MNLPPIRVDFENAIKNYLKEHLKIEIQYNSPSGLCKGSIKTTLKLDDEVIDSSEQKIYKSFF
jgi:hypothetical protein